VCAKLINFNIDNIDVDNFNKSRVVEYIIVDGLTRTNSYR